MTEYICPDCLKNFGNKKDHLERHKNRKIPCVKNKFILPNNLLITPPIPQNPLDLLPINLDLFNDNDYVDNNKNNTIKNDNIKFICEFCQGSFCKKFNLDRHLNICKKKIENIKNKSDEKLTLILKQNEELKKENKKLKKEIKNKKNKAITCNKLSDVNINIVNNVTNMNNNILNNNNNIMNNQQNIVNFNNMDYNNIDKKLFILPLMNSRLIGKEIILKMIENIYINVNLPEYQNIVITDKNRGYVKIYNNGQWKTDNLKIINTVIDGIVEHSKTILEELNLRYINNIQATNRLNTSKKYINLCDNEYLEELEDAQENEQANNKNEIKRCKDFRDMVFKDTINLFHDNKNILLKPKNFDLIDL
jgi:hypothetical protein